MNVNRRTKIICTIGPSSSRSDVLESLLLEGMDVARLNFSFGTHAEHEKVLEEIRLISEAVRKPVAVMQDLQGLKIRIGAFRKERVFLREGGEFVLTTQEIPGSEKRVSVNYSGLPGEVRVGDAILIDDGLIELQVIEKKPGEVVCRIKRGGMLSQGKGIHLPGIALRAKALTEKDVADLKFGIENEVDFIALSYVRNAGDVLELKRYLEEAEKDIPIIAKIEKREAVEHIDEIIAFSYGAMVARGDLGLDISPEEVPLIQKRVIEKCNHAGKSVITATQMLDSMIHNSSPTRAEASDVANAVFDGSDALMLSGETASGKYPVEAVRAMAKIAAYAESSELYRNLLAQKKLKPENSIGEATAHAACVMASNINASALMVATQSGYTAREVSKFRPQAKIIAITSEKLVMRRLLLCWGVVPILIEAARSIDELMDRAIEKALNAKMIQNGDVVVIVAGILAGIPTHLIRVHIVARELVKGMGFGGRIVKGRIHPATDPKRIEEGDVLVLKEGSDAFIPLFKKASAIITEESGLTSFTAIACRELNKPFIVGAKNAISVLKDRMFVTVDTVRGIVYEGDIEFKFSAVD